MERARERGDALGLVLLEDDPLARVGHLEVHRHARRRVRLVGATQPLEELEELVERLDPLRLEGGQRLEVRRRAIALPDRSRELGGDPPGRDVVRLLLERVLERVERERRILEVVAEQEPEPAAELPRHLGADLELGDARGALEHPAVGISSSPHS